ncbi:MAG TPA: hypothetical protein VF206_05865 [Rubrobacter sp.]
MIVLSPDAQVPRTANTYGRREREERAMNYMDLEVQRERRMELLREAESKRAVARRRSGNKPRAVSKLAGLWSMLR